MLDAMSESPDAMPGGDAMPPDTSCSPPLSITPAEQDVVPFGTVSFSVSGGTGEYRFELTRDGSGATVNQTSGIYVSGDLIDAQDQILVTDNGCPGGVSAIVRVLSRIEVAPRDVEMVPGTGFSFDISGGSGEYTCSFASDISGGSISSGSSTCSYTAGASSGVDIVRVRDIRTGDYVDANLVVSPEATLTIAGAGHIFVPEGHTFNPTPYGGSGHLAPAVLSGPFSISDGLLVADGSGRGTVRFTDRYTAMSVDVPVTSVAPRVPDIARDGERSSEGVIHSGDDLDGDGYPDAVLGFIELSVGAHYSGAVMVYAGSPSGGLDSAPAQIFAGSSRFETLGSDIEIADVNGDGELDLLIGADRSDQGSVNNGAVMIHYGVPDGFFEQEPSRVLRGENSGDRFGTSVVACDFDGDMFIDLAVGAVEAEDRNVVSRSVEQGAIHVFRGSASGFSDRAEVVLYGELPDEMGVFGPVANLELGHRLRAGDLDGDGLCDLAAAMPEHALDGLDDDGVVLIYQGTTQDNLTITRSPVRTYAAPDTKSLFGWRLAIADIDRDGADDLAIGQYKSDHSATQGGAVRIYLGGALDDRPAGDPVLPEDADWIVTGTTSYEYLGSGLAFVDFDGDPRPDLMVGAPRAEDNSPTNSGAVRVYSGASIAAAVASGSQYNASSDTPAFQLVGTLESSRLGQSVGAVGPGGIIALAGYDNTYGTQVGAPYFGSMSAPVAQLLDMPGEPAGHEVGSALTLHDVDGDGDRDLIIGGPGAGDPTIGGNSGMLFYYERQSGVLTDTWSPITNGYADHDAGDRYGFASTNAGDFNGDGIEDLAVISRGGSRPSSFGSDYANPSECPGSISRAGAVLVYLGSVSGIESDPAFVFYGIRSGGYTRVVRGGFDYDDDGYDDLVVGSRDWSASGGFAIVYGRPQSTGGILVICDSELYTGVESYARLGDSAAPIGDLDGDGCDEIAVGAPRENLGVTDQGVVRVMWGKGPGPCPSSQYVTTMVLTIRDSYLGSALDGGQDVDGDGINDLVVGGSIFTVDFARVGAAWVVPGSYIASLPRQQISVGSLPSTGSTEAWPVLPELGELGRYGVVGPMAASLFGDAVAMITDPVRPSRGALAVGIPLGNTGGTSFAGGVAVYRWVDDGPDGRPGLDPVPYALFGGETLLPEGLLGATLEGHRVAGVTTLLVGAPRSSQAGMDFGAGYVLRFE